MRVETAHAVEQQAHLDTFAGSAGKASQNISTHRVLAENERLDINAPPGAFDQFDQLGVALLAGLAERHIVLARRAGQVVVADYPVDQLSLFYGDGGFFRQREASLSACPPKHLPPAEHQVQRNAKPGHENNDKQPGYRSRRRTPILADNLTGQYDSQQKTQYHRDMRQDSRSGYLVCR